MAPKSLVLAALLIVVVVSASQLPRGAAGLGASPNTNTSFVVSGIVPCATGNSINLATVPSFPSKDTRIWALSSEYVLSVITVFQDVDLIYVSPCHLVVPDALV